MSLFPILSIRRGGTEHRETRESVSAQADADTRAFHRHCGRRERCSSVVVSLIVLCLNREGFWGGTLIGIYYCDYTFPRN